MVLVQQTTTTRLPVPMKAAPTVTVYPQDGVSAGQITMMVGDVAGTVDLATEKSFRVFGTNGVVSTTRKINYHYVAVSRP